MAEDNKKSESEGGGKEAFASKVLPDVIKRLVYSGIGAVFTSEEGIRRIASELTLPKEAVNYLVTQAQTTKNELFRLVAKEFRDFLESADFAGAMQKILTSLTFEIKMQVRLLPNKDNDGVRPEIRGKVKVKGSDDKSPFGDDDDTSGSGD